MQGTFEMQGEVFKAEPSADGRMVWLNIVTEEGEAVRTFGFAEDLGPVGEVPIRDRDTSITCQPYVKNGLFKARVVAVRSKSALKP